ncbi:MAG: hypothetical protein ABFD52_10125 [Acidobacteriota bacterium]
MSTQTTPLGNGNGKERYSSGYSELTGGITPIRTSRAILQDTVIYGENEPKGFFQSIITTGEALPVLPSSQTDTIKEIVGNSIEAVEDILELLDIDRIECLNRLTMFEADMRSLWNRREDVNEYFREILVHMLSAARDFRYNPINAAQCSAIRSVLKILYSLNIDRSQVKTALALLVDNKIDIFSPIRNWGEYTIEIRKQESPK